VQPAAGHGRGANTAAAELINHLSAYPELLLQMKAAARVGGRRWTLYLDSGITVQLPERNWMQAVRRRMSSTARSSSCRRASGRWTCGLPGRVIVEVAEAAAENAGPKKKAAAKRQ
jgi:cell division protein FtsQ